MLRKSLSGEHKVMYEFFWKIKTLPSIQVVAWRVLHTRVATREKLSRRWILLEANACVMCEGDKETNTHLFFTCKVAWLVWTQCYRWICESCNAITNIQSFRLLRLSNFTNIVWENMWIVVIGELWKHRNRVIFKEGRVNHLEISIIAQLKGMVMDYK